MSKEIDNNSRCNDDHGTRGKGSNEYTRLVDKSKFIPFGSYSADRKSTHIANEVLVGREKERASFIQRLLYTGRSGAFLVTGSRGVGKSTFVDYCIDELSKYYSMRVLLSNAGKHLADIFVILVMSCSIAIFPIIISHLLTLKMADFENSYLIIVPLTFIAIVPLIHSKQFIDAYRKTKYITKNHILPALEGKKHPKKDSENKKTSGVLKRLFVITFGISALFIMFQQGAIFLLFAYYLYILAITEIWKKVKNRLNYSIRTTFDPIKSLLPLVLIISFGYFITIVLSSIVDHFYVYNSYFWIGEAFYFQDTKLEKLLFESITKTVIQVEPYIHYLEVKTPFAGNPVLLNIYKTTPFIILVIAIHFIWVIFSLIVRSIWRRLSFSATSKNEKSEARKIKNLLISPEVRTLQRATPVVLITLSISMLYPAVYTVFLAPQSEVPLFLQGNNASISSTSLLSLACLAILVGVMQYNYIIKASRKWGTEPATTTIDSDIQKKLEEHEEYLKKDSKSLESSEGDLQRKIQINMRSYYRTANESSLFHIAYMFWLPLIKVKINLGFNTVSHPLVIKAMLIGLRDEYTKKFVSRTSYRSMFYRMFFISLSVFIGLNISAQLFSANQSVNKTSTLNNEITQNTPSDNTIPTPPAPHLIELLGLQEKLVPLLYLDIIQIENYQALPLLKLLKENKSYHCKIQNKENSDNLDQNKKFLVGNVSCFINETTPYETQDKTTSSTDESAKNQKHSYYLQLHDILVILITALLLTQYNKRVGLIPYRRNLNKINQLIVSITSSIQESKNYKSTLPPKLFKMPGQHLDSINITSSTQASDSRTIEYQMLSLLKSIQRRRRRFLGLKFSVPSPLVFFVFDELDKLTEKEDQTFAQASGDHQSSPSKIHTVISQHQHNIHQLLSEMKGLLSSGSAKFIFIGGRDLHDSWRSDKTQRNPLLTSVFEYQIYLGSLLQRFGRDNNELYQYFYQQHKRAWLQAELDNERANLPTLISSTNKRSKNKYHPESLKKKQIFTRLIPKCSNEKNSLLLTTIVNGDSEAQAYNAAFLVTLIDFLAFRSQGNPRKLNEYFSSFIRHKANLEKKRRQFGVTNSNAVQKQLNLCTTALVFPDIDQMRIQFLSQVFTRLFHNFHASIQGRDDRVISTVFYFTDFLFKFHKQPFAWNSIDKIDEMADITRSPDARGILHAIVEAMSPIFFDDILFGLKSHRFKSEFKVELDFLSRISKTEMAAMNFTLDESTPLREFYLEKLKEHGNKDVSLHTDIGEMFENDEVFDSARHHYRMAIHYTDQKLATYFNIPFNENAPFSDHKTANDFLKVIQGNDHNAIETFYTWFSNRLHLIMQIALTYEKARDLEQAKNLYKQTVDYSNNILKTLFKNDINDQEVKTKYYDFSHVLFQPFFCLLWVTEKTSNQIGLSDIVIEDYMPEPLREEKKREENQSKQHFSKTALAELKNKLGDYYFLRGKGSTFGESGTQETPIEKACNLYEQSMKSLEFESNSNATPDFVARAYASSAIDLAEGFLSRVSIVNYANSLETALTNRSAKIKEKADRNSPTFLLQQYFDYLSKASDQLINSGYPESAVAENLRFIKTATHTIRWVSHYLQSKGNKTKPGLEAIYTRSLDISQKSFYLSLRLSCYSSKTANQQHVDFQDLYEKGNNLTLLQVPQAGVYLGLLLTLGDIYVDEKSAETGFLYKLLAASPLKAEFENGRAKAFDLLEKLLDVYRFPILNRLEGLTSLLHNKLDTIDTQSPVEWKELEEIFARGQEIEVLQRQVDAPWHFPTIVSGHLYYRLWKLAKTHFKKWKQQQKQQKLQKQQLLLLQPQLLQLKREIKLRCEQRLKEEELNTLISQREFWLYRANIHLRKSRETYTLRREYYEQIADLYYLHDEFNDRNIHHTHALQMLGSDLADSCIEELQKDLAP